VISGRTSNVRLMQQLIDVHGPHPDQWLPPFSAALSAPQGTAFSMPSSKEKSHA